MKKKLLEFSFFVFIVILSNQLTVQNFRRQLIDSLIFDKYFENIYSNPGLTNKNLKLLWLGAAKIFFSNKQQHFWEL